MEQNPNSVALQVAGAGPSVSIRGQRVQSRRADARSRRRVLVRRRPAPRAAPIRGAGSGVSETVVVRGGIALHTEEHGPAGAPIVVLLHGFPDTSAVWDPVVRELEGILRVVTYDVRGAGQSGAPADVAGYRLEHLVADFEAVIASRAPR